MFFNISSLKNKGTKPEVGDSVVFVLTTDNKNRLKATKVAIDSLPKTSNSQQNNIEVEPKTINTLDCLLIAVLIFSVTFAEYTYFKTTNIGRSFIFSLPAIIAFIFLGRQKKPKNSSFQCTKCRKIESHHTRTIKAWNRGSTHFYCNACHTQWLIKQQRKEP